jgi:hypothetical protein
MENITTENKPQVGGMQVFKKTAEEKAEIKKMKASYKQQQSKNKTSSQN